MPTENTYQSIPSLRKIEIEYLAWQAHLRFGRQNVERWVSEGRLQRYKRPGKIEYRLENLYKCALDPYDY